MPMSTAPATHASHDRAPVRQSWLTLLQRFLFARTSLEAQLYPPLKAAIRFRPYEPRDYDSCLAIYRKNEPGRFPENHGQKFEQFLKKENKTLIIAECDSRVVGYGGISLAAPNVAILCYGIVDPEFQGRRIGATLTLLRIAQLAPAPPGIFVFIFAVDASMPAYRRFGFIEKTRWTAEDGKHYPAALLSVPLSSLQRVKSTLNRRQVRVQGNLHLQTSDTISCIVEPDTAGLIHFRFQARKDDVVPPGPIGL